MSADVTPDAPSGPPSPQAITTGDIARLAGVSTKTVSRVLNGSSLLSEATRAKVQSIIDETGFVPNAQARALALRRNFLVALVHDGSDAGPIDAVANGMDEALRGGEMALVLHRLHGDAWRELRLFLSRHRPAAVVLMPPLSGHQDLEDLCRDAGASCVRLGHARDGTGLGIDERAAMAGLVDYLVAEGHRRIALISGPEASLTAQQRELGYLDAMADHGLDRGPALIETGDNSFASGLAATRLLLEVSPRPSAIIACNDAMAAGAIQAAGLAGVTVPDSLSVTSFDDTPLAAMTSPPLTAVHVPWRDLGRIAAQRALAREADEASVPGDASRIVVRGSVAPGPAHAGTPASALSQAG